MKPAANKKVSNSYPREKLKEVFGPALEFDKSLAPFTTYQTGGPARYYLRARSAEEVARAVAGARDLEVPFHIVGGGSNLLVADGGVDGVVIKVDVRGLDLISDTEIECGAGEDLMDLVTFAADHSLTGLEFASGIWGTVGGAIYGNAGAYGGEIKDVLTQVDLVDQTGRARSVEPAYCRFSYRDSYLKVSHEIVVKSRLKLAAGDQHEIRAKMQEILALRAAKHPVDGRSCGCFFKNIPDASQPFGKLAAGKLLEQVGAKGMKVGGAVVYEKHANMIVNTGNATSKDIRELADILKQKVFDKFGITLEEEVVQLGEF